MIGEELRRDCIRVHGVGTKGGTSVGMVPEQLLMTRYNPMTGTSSVRGEDRPSTGDSVAASLRRAFPLPRDDHGQDARFRQLLEALAERTKATDLQAE